MSNIKNLLDDIINDTKNSYNSSDRNIEAEKLNNEIKVFDKVNFREKLSMFVLKDIIHAMMHDETKDLDEMIDMAIMKHIHDDYKGTCYGYLNKACDNIKSPLVQDIIQEINSKTDDVAPKVAYKKCEDDADKTDISDIVKNVADYDELRQKIKDRVSKKVIDDCAVVIAKSNDAPVFDNLDDKLVDAEETTTESMIINMSGKIVYEHYTATKETMDTETALNHAIINYCINEMDMLFKHNEMNNMFYAKYA